MEVKFWFRMFNHKFLHLFYPSFLWWLVNANIRLLWKTRSVWWKCYITDVVVGCLWEDSGGYMTGMCACEENRRTARGNAFNVMVKPLCKEIAVHPIIWWQTNQWRHMQVSAICSCTLKITMGGMLNLEEYVQHSKVVVTPFSSQLCL
jgi:hypothetical protein